MSQHVGKSGENCISSILSSKRGITPTKIGGTQNWSEVYLKKNTYKISAQYYEN